MFVTFELSQIFNYEGQISEHKVVAFNKSGIFFEIFLEQDVIVNRKVFYDVSWSVDQLFVRAEKGKIVVRLRVLLDAVSLGGERLGLVVFEARIFFI